MVGSFLFFLLAGGTLTAFAWMAMELFRRQEDPLSDRLDELQSQALVVSQRAARRKTGGGGWDRFLDVVAMVPGGEDWMHESERLLNRAGLRRKYALPVYVILTLVFVILLTAGML